MTSSHYYNRTTCRICDSKHLQSIIPIASTPVGDHFISSDAIDTPQPVFPLELFVCKECNLVQLTGILTPEIIYRDYLYETSISLGLKEHFKEYAESTVQKISPGDGTLVIDIGSNDGTLLKYFKKHGLSVLGVEPAAEIAEKATKNGINTISGYFSPELASDIQISYGKAAIVTANNVFANIDDIHTFITGVKAIMAHDGVCIIETGYIVDLIQNSILDNIYHEHLSYFSVTSLHHFFQLHDLELIGAERTHMKGGSIRVTIQAAGGPRNALQQVRELMILENELGFNRYAPYQVFADRMQRTKENLKKTLLQIRKEGKTIAGYGASVGVTTLLYFWQLGDIVSYLFDDNPIKFNTFSPGHHIEVMDSKALTSKQPDYVIIFAWRYADPIIRKHHHYSSLGGKFILPLPTIELI